MCMDSGTKDMKVKTAQYISKNMELNQEFYFTHPSTKLKINLIYNSHYSGSPIWNLFGPGSLRIQSSYNRSVKVMLDLPLSTHRSLIQPLTGVEHVKLSLIKRFLGFLDKIRCSNKKALNMLLQEAMMDVRSVTGANLRNIMLLVDKKNVKEVKTEDWDKIVYCKQQDVDNWKISMIWEIIDTKTGIEDIPGFDSEELEFILHHICTE